MKNGRLVSEKTTDEISHADLKRTYLENMRDQGEKILAEVCQATGTSICRALPARSPQHPGFLELGKNEANGDASCLNESVWASKV